MRCTVENKCGASCRTNELHRGEQMRHTVEKVAQWRTNAWHRGEESTSLTTNCYYGQALTS